MADLWGFGFLFVVVVGMGSFFLFLECCDRGFTSEKLMSPCVLATISRAWVKAGSVVSRILMRSSASEFFQAGLLRISEMICAASAERCLLEVSVKPLVN